MSFNKGKQARLREKMILSLESSLLRLEEDFSGSLSLRFDLSQGGLRRVGVTLFHELKIEEAGDGQKK